MVSVDNVCQYFSYETGWTSGVSWAQTPASNLCGLGQVSFSTPQLQHLPSEDSKDRWLCEGEVYVRHLGAGPLTLQRHLPFPLRFPNCSLQLVALFRFLTGKLPYLLFLFLCSVFVLGGCSTTLILFRMYLFCQVRFFLGKILLGFLIRFIQIRYISGENSHLHMYSMVYAFIRSFTSARFYNACQIDHQKARILSPPGH